MKILDKEIDFSLTVVENMEKMQNALSKIENMKIEPKNDIEKLKFLCNAIRDCFIEIFGNDDMLPKENDYVLLFKAFQDLAYAYKNKNETGMNELKAALTKYGIQ